MIRAATRTAVGLSAAVSFDRNRSVVLDCLARLIAPQVRARPILAPALAPSGADYRVTGFLDLCERQSIRQIRGLIPLAAIGLGAQLRAAV